MLSTSCKKVDLQNEENGVLISEGQTLTAQSSSAKAFPFNYSENVPLYWFAENLCTGEWVAFSGTLHYKIHWVVNDNRLIYHLYYNMSGVKGVGLSTGAQFISTQSFNYTNNVSYVNQQILYQQRETLKFISKGSQNDLLLQND